MHSKKALQNLKISLIIEKCSINLKIKINCEIYVVILRASITFPGGGGGG